MISVRRLAPMRSERLCTSSGSTVRISSRKGSEVTSLLYLEASGAWRETISDHTGLSTNRHKPSLTFRPASARSPSKKPSAGRGLLLLKRAGKERKHSSELGCKTLKRPLLWCVCGKAATAMSPLLPSHPISPSTSIPALEGHSQPAGRRSSAGSLPSACCLCSNSVGGKMSSGLASQSPCRTADAGSVPHAWRWVI